VAVRHVHEGEIRGERAPEPNARTLKHLAAPWTLGTTRLWLGLSEIDPGSSSNLQSHESEEIFYVVSGQGVVEVDGESQQLEAGSVVFVPSGARHRLRNRGSGTLRVVCAAAPAFERGDFDRHHLLEARADDEAGR
jgi:mannose-6-phosphate isomerase-like protein (cupin superfamily)